MSFSRTDSSPEVQRSGAAGILLGYESSCFNHARYDTANNLLSLQSSNTNGASVGYAYDALNRLQSVTDNRLTSGQSTTTYSYL